MLYDPLVRVAPLLLVVRGDRGVRPPPRGDVRRVPFVPTPAGQYLPKDLAPFVAAMAIGASLRHEQ
jgi:hypothetical protein